LRITPPVVGLLANLGYKAFAVREKPKVSIVVTGDELIQPGKMLGPGQIYDSNSYALESALTALGISNVAIIHARDTRKETKEAFKQAFAESDVVISSGGVSVGDHDYVKEILEGMNVRTIFWRVKIKPGKPVYFGVLEAKTSQQTKLIFGLPGNPVSVLVTFHQFVKPALLKLMGASKQNNAQFAASNKKRLKKVPGRLDFVRGRLSCTEQGQLEVAATTGQDSHMLSGLAFADCLVHFDEDAEYLEDGQTASIDLISWTE
jgi:molybdopterin molybdotransferase